MFVSTLTILLCIFTTLKSADPTSMDFTKPESRYGPYHRTSDASVIDPRVKPGTSTMDACTAHPLYRAVLR